DVAFDVDVHRVDVHPGQIEGDDKFLSVLPSVHEHRGGPGRRAEDVLVEPVELAKRVGAHQHGYLTPYRSCMTLPSQIIYSGCDRFFITPVPHWCKRLIHRS